MSSITDTPVLKKHKKHKRDKGRSIGNKSDGGITPSFSGTTGSNRLKLILKVAGSSISDQSDSQGPSSSLSVLNVGYDEDCQQSNMSHSKKSKKKDKKNKKKEKKHKHRHKEKRKREKGEIGIGENSMSFGMDMDAVESTSSAMLAVTSKVLALSEIRKTSPSSQGRVEVDIGPIGRVGPAGGSLEEPLEEIKPLVPTLYRQKPGEKQAFLKLLDHLLRALQKKDPQNFFAWPVTDKIAPGYSTIIKKPMDFSTMKSKIGEAKYNTLPEFIEDFKLICNNAMIYNGTETIYYKTAKKNLQNGLRSLDPEKIRYLLPLIPSIRLLSEDALGFCLLPDQLCLDNLDNSQSEEDKQENICLDPTKSIHYVPPHPNDPPDLCGAFSDDLTTEEILHQARIAAREVAHRLATKKPNSKMGFLRQRDDGSTSLAILTPTTGVIPGIQEQPVTLNVIAGKLHQGTTQLQGCKDEKKNMQSIDSTFSNLTPSESDLVRKTYGEEAAIQYAESIIEFAKGSDYAMYMVDEHLDSVTQGEHKKTVNVIEERKRIEKEEAFIKKEQEEFVAQLEMEWANATKSAIQPDTFANANIDSLRSLSEFGIDPSFVDDLKNPGNPEVTVKLEETAQLIGDLQKAQNHRLPLTTQPHLSHVTLPSDDEVRLADRITENLTELDKGVSPGSIVSEEALKKVMGVDLDSATFRYSIPGPMFMAQPQTAQFSTENIGQTTVPMEVNESMELKPDVAPTTAMEIIGESSESNILTSEGSLELPLSLADSTINMSETVPTPLGGEPTISWTTGTPPEINEILVK